MKKTKYKVKNIETITLHYKLKKKLTALICPDNL